MSLLAPEMINAATVRPGRRAGGRLGGGEDYGSCSGPCGLPSHAL